MKKRNNTILEGIDEITTEEQYEVAISRIESLMSKKHGGQYAGELDRLVDLVVEYESKLYNI